MSAGEERRRFWWRKAIVTLLFTAYFVVVNRDGLKAQFAADDMLALHIYWQYTPWKWVATQFLLWRGYFRPMVGIFYLPIFARSGLDPGPYHVALLVLLWIGAWQVYRLARALGAGELAAAFAALIACYHGGLANLYYNTVYVGDVLCGIFYWSALALYARVRSAGKLLSAGQTAAFLALYLCALNSKEMAVTMPAMMLAYEVLYQGLPWRKLGQWLRGPGVVISLAGILDVISLYGKRFGPEGLMNNPAYQPMFSWARIVEFQERYIGDIFYQLQRFDGATTVAIWLVVTYFAWRRDRPILRFCWVSALITSIPVEFISGRGEANIYVTLAGWAIMAGTLFVDWAASAARVLSGENLFRAVGQAGLRVTVVAAGMIVLAWQMWSFKERWVVPVIPLISPLTEEVLAQFRAVNPRVKPGATVVILEDPWTEGYDMYFIARLWFGDRNTTVFLGQKRSLTQDEIARADAVYTWRDHKLVQIR